MVANVLNIHLTVSYAGAAVVTSVHIDLYADYCELVEETVYSSERADKAAEEAVQEYASETDYSRRSE